MMCYRMIRALDRTGCIILFLACSGCYRLWAASFVVPDAAGCLDGIEAPVEARCRLSPPLLKAGHEGRLAVQSLADAGPGSVVPAQVHTNRETGEVAIVFMMPKVRRGASREFRPISMRGRGTMGLGVNQTSSGQFEIVESGTHVLRYNYRTVDPGEVAGKVSEANRIYARARSDYIHPLWGLGGEELTKDWSLDHPHHRGIYWAWPEVDFGTNRADLHALQGVFARRTGRIRVYGGPVFAEIEAENDWLWEDREVIVRETATIRAYRRERQGRFIDLSFRFVGLRPGITIARRGTDKYGGLNIRMATPEGQSISVLSDVVGNHPRRAWSDLSGVFGGQGAVSGMVVLQHAANPDYPGDWVQYPELSWCQPTFPASGSRFPLLPDKPLVLRYRLWVHNGGTPETETLRMAWDSFHDTQAAIP
jgi:hypothetical protein